jgi:hypothetical protein
LSLTTRCRMLFDWREFLIIAYELRIDQREAAKRTCLGRAYYYVFNLGLEMARQMGWSKPERSVHTALWKWCERHSDINIKRLGNLGFRMHSLRIDSDYIARPLSDAQAVQKQLGRARDFEVRVAQQNGQTPPTALL